MVFPSLHFMLRFQIIVICLIVKIKGKLYALTIIPWRIDLFSRHTMTMCDFYVNVDAMKCSAATYGEPNDVIVRLDRTVLRFPLLRG